MPARRAAEDATHGERGAPRDPEAGGRGVERVVWCSASVTGLRIGSLRACTVSATSTLARLFSKSHSKVIGANSGSLMVSTITRAARGEGDRPHPAGGGPVTLTRDRPRPAPPLASPGARGPADLPALERRRRLRRAPCVAAGGWQSRAERSRIARPEREVDRQARSAVEPSSLAARPARLRHVRAAGSGSMCHETHSRTRPHARRLRLRQQLRPPPERFYARLDPAPVAAPRLVRVNEGLAEQLGRRSRLAGRPRGRRRSWPATACPRAPSRWRWPTPATSSATSCPGSATAAPSCWARWSAGTASGATSSSRAPGARPSRAAATAGPRSGPCCASTSWPRPWRRSASRPPARSRR